MIPTQNFALLLLVAAATSLPNPDIRFQDSHEHGTGVNRRTTARPATVGGNARPTTATPSFTANETICFAQNKVLYAGDNKCYKLREKGPCADDTQWLVIDLDSALSTTGDLRPVCKPCRCCDKPQRVYWPADQQCHKLSERATLCPFAGNELRNDPFGEGECGCDKSPAHLRYETEALNATRPFTGACYPLYRRGPCRPNHVLTPVAVKGYGTVGRCTADPCRAENAVGTASYAQYEGRCYALGTRGPCATPEEKFAVHPVTFLPRCNLPVNNIFKLPERCQTDTSGDCQKEINLSEDDRTLFAIELLMSAEKRKKRRT